MQMRKMPRRLDSNPCGRRGGRLWNGHRVPQRYSRRRLVRLFGREVPETLLQFIERLKEIEKDWESNKDGEPGLWYRRARKCTWRLIPKLYRPRRSIKELLSAEDEIREEFIRRAPGLTAHKPANAWEWYFLMQHYGSPTRLLDWTENPQMGLYFAVNQSVCRAIGPAFGIS